MKIYWHVDPSEIEKVQSFLKSHQDKPVVTDRIAQNLRDDKPTITKEEFWHRMVVCLLTTQQRSGPNRAADRFSKQTPFPLRYDACVRQGDLLNSFAWHELTNFGGLRFIGRTAGELVENLHYLEINGGWDQTMSALDKLRLNQTVECEREAADFIEDKFDGFGPKQSRNLLQCLGLSRYEIPLDSRITKWLNDFGFPVFLSAESLADRNYYGFVSAGFQRLCHECGVVPCVLDAAICASCENDGSTDE